MRDTTCPGVLEFNPDRRWTPGELVKTWTPLRWILVIAVVVCSGGLGASELFAHWDMFASDPVDTVPVVVVNHYVPPFTPVNPKEFSVKGYPPDLVPPGAFHALKELISDSEQPLFTTAVALPVGQPLTRTLVTAVDRSHGMASILPIGQVAVSFSVDKVRAAGGWIKPGDTVSIFTSTPVLTPDHHESAVTKLLFPAAHIIAVNKGRLGEDKNTMLSTLQELAEEQAAEDDYVLTVRMNPVEAAALIQARESGRLSIVLRALGDETPGEDPTHD